MTLKPDMLYSFGKSCHDSVVAGNVLRALCGQDVELAATEAVVVEMIRADMASLETRREAWREAKQSYRKVKRPPMSEGQSETGECPTMSEGQGEVEKMSALTDPVNTDPVPTVPILPTHIKTEPNPNTCACARTRARKGSGSARYKGGEIFSWDDERLYSCDYGQTNVLEMYLCTFGTGLWAAAVRELGEDMMLSALSTMCHEVRAGEAPRNPAAAMTARLKKLLAAKGGQG